MNYEAILIDQQRGHHRRGTGPNPPMAILKALRQILAVKAADDTQWPIPKVMTQDGPKTLTPDEIQPEHILMSFGATTVEDTNMENLKTLKEDFNDMVVIVRVDRTKENMYCPCGWVRPIF